MSVMIDIVVEIDERGLIQALDVVSEKFKNTSELLSLIGRHMARSMQDTIDARGRPGKWKELSKSTKRRRGENAEPLKDSGKLYASIMGEVSGNEVLIGPSVEYATWQDRGTDDGRIPARPFIQILDGDVDRIEKMAGEWVDQIIG